MWNGHYDTQVPPIADDLQDWFQVIAEVDLVTTDGTPDPEIRWFHYDPQSGDTEPVSVARFDLTGVNYPSEEGRFNRLRFQNRGSTRPWYWIEDIDIRSSGDDCTHDPVFDVDDDGDVDQDDFGVFQVCLESAWETLSEDCQRMDVTGPDGSPDQIITADDYAAFENCASGPAIPALATCDDL
jgi:hypothetical protein